MDDFTTHIEELNAKLTKKNSSSQQNMALPAEACNGSVPTSFFISSLGNGSLMPNSSSSSQLAKESPLMDEVPWLSVSFNPLIFIFIYFFLIVL